jgi:signal transduction histidine kinase/ligand-binding sensor domain-containing protein
MNADSPDSRGSAAAPCGEARPHRYVCLNGPSVEAQPRRKKSGWDVTVSQRLIALRRGRAALLVAVLLLIAVLLPTAYCLLPTALSQNQPQPIQTQPSPTPTPSPSPSPSPTAPPNLHQWGAVTSFHGLPSDRAHAIAQTEFGVTWFATDRGLARYDGRRTQAVTSDQLPPGRVLALKADDDGALWIGTENGAARFADGKFELIKETQGKVITAIISPQRGRALMATENGVIFDCHFKQENASRLAVTDSERNPPPTLMVSTIPAAPLESADKDHPGLLNITSLAFVGDSLYAGTQSRGLLQIENGEAKEVVSKPRSFFINALETDSRGRLWVGARARVEEGGLFDSGDPLKPRKVTAATGPVTAIARGTHDDMWVGTDGKGAFHFQDGKLSEHFTFVETGGALRSDHVFAVFVDAEEVVWFATDKGVCRYDPNAARTESISGDANANYLRALLRTSRGRLLAGTNSGLYLNDAGTNNWSAVSELGRRTVYALAEDRNGRVLVGTATGLFASSANDLAFARVSSPSERLPQGDNIRAVTNVEGTTYIATYGYGVERLQGSQRTLVWPETSADNQLREVTALASDSSGRLVIGTSNGAVFFWDGKQASPDAALDKLKGDAIWSMLADSNGLWLASARGLYFFQAGQLREVAPGVNARSLAVSADSSRAGQIWCATVGSGLLRVALDDQFGAIVSRLDVEQGLPSQRVFAVLSERAGDGKESIIAGTNRGLVRYDPGQAKPTVMPSRIISQRIHEPAELKAGLKLDYPQNSLLLDVTAISSRTFPEQFQYAFALYDSAGKVIRQKLSHDSQFAMEKLSPGKYKVVARAFTKDLTPADPLSFEFTVARAPFPFTSTALGILLLLALIALAWGYVQNRRIHRTSAELAAANRELADARLQLANETETERRRIARDLHDQTLADLRNLALLVDQLPSSGAETRLNRAPSAPGALRHEIESISQEVRRICEDLSPSALENVGLSAALQFALAHAVEHAAPDCKFDYEFVCEDGLDEKLNLPASTQIQVYRVAQEALSNICRHAKAKHVTMTAGISPTNTFELTIEDDGRGFDGGEAKKIAGRGLANIRARASMIDADVEWSKRAVGGTVFRLQKEGAGASPPSQPRDFSN